MITNFKIFESKIKHNTFWLIPVDNYRAEKALDKLGFSETDFRHDNGKFYWYHYEDEKFVYVGCHKKYGIDFQDWNKGDGFSVFVDDGYIFGGNVGTTKEEDDYISMIERSKKYNV